SVRVGIAHGAVAVVVMWIGAALGRAGVVGVVAVVAVAGDRHGPGGRVACARGRARVPVAVAVPVGVPGAHARGRGGGIGVVGERVAVVVGVCRVAALGAAGVYAGVSVVAVAPGRHRAARAIACDRRGAGQTIAVAVGVRVPGALGAGADRGVGVVGEAV